MDKLKEIRMKRAEHRITLKELGNEIGLSNGTLLSRIETGATNLTDGMYSRLIEGIDAIAKRREAK